MKFSKGFRKALQPARTNTAQYSTLHDEKFLYPEAFTASNLSGSDKVAMMHLPQIKPPASPVGKITTAIKAEAKPKRVTPTVRPGNPVFGQNGLTGAPAIEPFGRATHKFGLRSKPRNLKGLS